jgi:hypothetical protein
MKSITSYLNSLGRGVRVGILALAVVFVSAGLAQAATTISTNIETAGTLSVTDQTTLGNASTTLLTAYSGFFGTSATSTLGADGSLTLVAGLTGTTGSFSSTLGVTGVTTLVNASTSKSLTVAGPLWVGGNATTSQAGNISTNGTLDIIGAATLASTTATGMKVGQVGTRMTRIVSGYCVTGSITIPATNASSTQTYANCTPSGGTSIISSGDRVFVNATSSLPYYIVLQSASSTSDGLINVSLTNFSTSTSPAAYAYAFNFWAFQ